MKVLLLVFLGMTVANAGTIQLTGKHFYKSPEYVETHDCRQNIEALERKIEILDKRLESNTGTLRYIEDLILKELKN